MGTSRAFELLGEFRIRQECYGIRGKEGTIIPMWRKPPYMMLLYPRASAAVIEKKSKKNPNGNLWKNEARNER